MVPPLPFPPRPLARRAASCFALAVLCVTPSSASAAERITRGGLAFQANPLGLRLESEVSWRRPLTSSASPSMKDARVAAGLTNQLTPAYDGVRGWVEIAPTSFLEVRAGVEGLAYFGTFGHLTPFPSYSAGFDDDARRARKGEAEARLARRAFVTPALQARFGRVSFRGEGTFESWRVAGAPGPFVFEPSRGTLIASSRQRLLASSAVLLADVTRARNERLRLGLLYDALEVDGAPRNDRRRLGALALARLRGRGERDVTLTIGVFDHLRAPDRAGLGGLVAISLGPRREDPGR